MRKSLALAVAGGTTLALAAAPTAAFAGTASGPMVVSATVLSTATVTTTPLAFGNYDPTAGTALAGTGTVVVTATGGTPYTIALDNGSNALTGQRRLTDGAGHYLNYNLYSDSGHTTAWNSTTTVAGSGTALAQTFTVYGQIPASQSATTGAYTDTVTATVNF